MNFYIVIPAHNEEDHIGLCLESLVQQTQLPKQIIVVNDNSTDNTATLIKHYTDKYAWITSLTINSSEAHIPGRKVIHAFYKGLELLDDDYDIICKYDADIIFPKNYIASVAQLFKADKTVGIAGGLPYILNNDTWIYETVASKSHVRGPIKSYRKACFKAIGGLKNSIGWDTADVLLAQFNGWNIQTDRTLHVKHLKPTGKTYSKNTKYLQGEGLYKMRFGLILAFISASKSAFNKKSLAYLKNTTIGYLKAKFSDTTPMVTEEEGKFIRRLRWKNILKKIF
ncbi:MAG: glycosyltransferase family 2 protein [Flavobacteriaceae bacterium]|nr:glycosyltransferase family 2 protein [Flavobacteriaceae bacterium]